MFYVLLCVTLYPFQFYNHLDGEERERELIALLSLSSWCLVIVDIVWLFLAVPWFCLQFFLSLYTARPSFEYCRCTLYPPGCRMKANK